MLKAFLRFYPRRMLAHGSRHCTYLVLCDNEIHVLLSRTAKRIHLKVIIPQECAAEECGANFYTVSQVNGQNLENVQCVFGKNDKIN